MAPFDVDERAAFVATMNTLLSQTSPPEHVREVVDGGDPIDMRVWKQLGQLGALSVLVPTDFDGLGGSPSDAMVLVEHLSAHLSIVPFVSSAVLATSALASASTSELTREWLPKLAAGEATAAVVTDILPTWNVRPSGEHELRGDVGFVLDGATSDLLLVPGRSADGELAWFGLVASALQAEPLMLHDPTRRAARVAVDGLFERSSLLTRGQRARDLLALLRDLAACAVAADSVGSAQRCLDLTVEYAETRVQFGHPIGTFQAVKHRCTDMFIDVVASRAALNEALDATDSGTDARQRKALASIAKNQCTSRHVRVAGAAVQLHGGIGFTWEHDLHFHLKRGLLNEAVFGASLEHNRAIWEHICDADGGEQGHA